MLLSAAAAAAQAAEITEGGGAAALGVLVRVAKLEAALREERAAAAQARTVYRLLFHSKPISPHLSDLISAI